MAGGGMVLSGGSALAMIAAGTLIWSSLEGERQSQTLVKRYLLL